MRAIRNELESQHKEGGRYREFAILDETCAVMLGVEYAIAMARIRIANRPTV